MKRLATPDYGDTSLHERSGLTVARRYTKKPLLTVAFIIAISTATFADTDWTDYVVPGTQSGTQIPYQPVYPGGPGGNYDTPMCFKGTLREDAAWYRLCICTNNNTICTIWYESIATYQCPDGKLLWVMTARGKTDKKCGKSAIQRTAEIIKGLNSKEYEGKYDYTASSNETYPSDSEISKLIVDKDKKPDENSKKAEEKKETKEETKTTKEGGSGSGKTEKRPRKHVTKKSNPTHARRETETHRQTETNSGNGGFSIGIGIGGFGGHGRGGEGRSSDTGGAKN